MIETHQYEPLGAFTIQSDKLRVSDPCYKNKDVEYAGNLENCRTGKWTAYISRGIEPDEYGRVSKLLIQHTDSKLDLTNFDQIAVQEDGRVSFTELWNKMPFDIGVDSGQVCVCDETYYYDETQFDDTQSELPFSCDDVWYTHCCALTLSETGAGILPHGAVSESGFGDGCYPGFFHRGDDGKIDAVIVIFF